MNPYTLYVEMDEATAQSLRDAHFTLFGLHAVAASAQGAPTIWLSTHNVDQRMKVQWCESYSMFVNPQTAILPGGVAKPTVNYPAQPGSVLTVNSDNGTGTVSPGGPAGHLEIDNAVDQRFTVGVCVQDSQGGFQPCGVFDLYGRTADLFRPLPRMAFFFTPIPYNKGTVIEQAIEAGLLVDFADAPDHTRTVSYSTETGWSCGRHAWGEPIEPRQWLSSLLIERSSALQALATQRQRTLSS